VLTRAEYELLERARASTQAIIAVDDFDSADLVAGRRPPLSAEPARPTLKSAA
jgi:hypothetical protein